ncbi:conserved exported hypothetical protein [Candidatus Sulfopaludibacter sp. SbA3]|nr:conserved exported hypothetical protein [Candidatus Sulfopaludibacter sp. SbA3]
MKALALLLSAASVWGAADDDPIAVLMRVRDRVMAHAERIPNHTCVETIVRDWYDLAAGPPPSSCDALLGRRKKAGVGTLLRLATTDRLRLDVALTETQEIYSWAGAARFEEGGIDRLVPTGAIGTGSFAATLLSIFEARDPKFVYEGETTVESRRVMEYSFNVSEEQSHYQVKAGGAWLITGYTGTLLADPVTADLVRLSVRTEELPKATNACEIDTTLNYGMLRIGSEEYLLPTLTRERFINQTGSEAENAITFAACREFRGESVVSFGGNVGTAEGKSRAAIAPVPPWDLPAGLPVMVELTSTIQVDQAAAGDRIRGRLAAPIRDARKEKILAPEGAALEGRLMRVETRYGHPNDVSIALRWETLEVDGVKAPFTIVPDWQTRAQTIRRPGELPQRPMVFELPRPGEGRYATLHFSSEHVVVNSGVRSPWFTSKP